MTYLVQRASGKDRVTFWVQRASGKDCMTFLVQRASGKDRVTCLVQRASGKDRVIRSPLVNRLLLFERLQHVLDELERDREALCVAACRSSNGWRGSQS